MDQPACHLESFLAAADVDDAVFELRPAYRALLVAVDGIVPGPSDATSETLLRAAEAGAQARSSTPVEELPHAAAWRDAYRAFGAKPQRTRNSLEALTRRAIRGGLPRINRLADLYNTISVLHQVPLGGEDLERYAGSPRLVRAQGTEPFDTVADGIDVVEHPEPGEVIWTDDLGVTCRRWNWRQCRRTHLGEHTTAAVFILDALAPFTDDDLNAAAEHLIAQLRNLGPHLQVAHRLIARDDTNHRNTKNRDGQRDADENGA